MIATSDKPCAAPGLASWRYRGTYGWIMIGANNGADAMREAARSTDAPMELSRLQRWNGKEYVCE